MLLRTFRVTKLALTISCLVLAGCKTADHSATLQSHNGSGSDEHLKVTISSSSEKSLTAWLYDSLDHDSNAVAQALGEDYDFLPKDTKLSGMKVDGDSINCKKNKKDKMKCDLDLRGQKTSDGFEIDFDEGDNKSLMAQIFNMVSFDESGTGTKTIKGEGHDGITCKLAKHRKVNCVIVVSKELN